MKHFLRQMPEGWDREFLPPEWTKPQDVQDNFGCDWVTDIKIVGAN
jgi:hypothetical protein